MPGPCFWPEEEASILATPFLSVSLLSITHPHLGAFCAEEGFISWVGYSEWGDLLGLGEGSQKWEEVRKLEVGPPSAQVPPSRVATMNPTLGSLLLSSKTTCPHCLCMPVSLPTAFAWVCAPTPLQLGPCERAFRCSSALHSRLRGDRSVGEP